MIWHSASIDDIEQELSANSRDGLSENEAALRIQKHGENKLIGKPPKTMVQRFFAQFKDFMVIILIAAAVISFMVKLLDPERESLLKCMIEPLAIMAIVTINALMGVIQESKAEKSLEALKNLSSPSAKVIRDATVKLVSAPELVPGDLIFIEAGDFIPADARIISSNLLRCDESALTGENVPVEKDEHAEIVDIATVGDRFNMVYSGSCVVNGNAKAIVTETGMSTEMGKIATLLDNEREQLTPLQKRLVTLGKQLGILAIIICVILFIIGLITGTSPITMFMTSVSLAVAAIPEGLPAIVTIVLALGVSRMVKKQAIIRRIPSVETLGSTSVICSDKTGTLTQNKMTLVSAFTERGFVKSMTELDDVAVTLLRFAAICCDAKIETNNDETEAIGDPTEVALVMSGIKYTGTTKEELENLYPRLAEIPFDSTRKLMTTVNMISGKPIAIVKGAPDILFDRCVDVDRETVEKANEMMASKALRVLAICYKTLNAIPTDPSPDELEYNLNFVGLVGLIDPPREEAKTAIAECKNAGITPVMITGDHIVTASAIAKELGIFDDDSIAVTGNELSEMSDDELLLKIKNIRVYARVSPEDKIRIVKAWQQKGEVVAMTGDGVNDAPALKAADIGCAMGITGTDVAKGAADMILTDDNFSTIVSAVKEGRNIYENIRKTIQFLIGCNIGEILCVFFAICIWQHSPLLAMQLLWINLVTDGFSAIALGMEPPGYDLMQRKPIGKKESILGGYVKTNILISGITIGVISLIAYAIGIKTSLQHAETMTFAVLAFSQLVNSYNSRSNHSVFKIGIFKNKYVNLAFLAGISTMLLLLLTPFGEIFSLVHLPMSLWKHVIILSFVPLFVFELYKIIRHFIPKKNDN